jgi:hypothetical protein
MNRHLYFNLDTDVKYKMEGPNVTKSSLDLNTVINKAHRQFRTAFVGFLTPNQMRKGLVHLTETIKSFDDDALVEFSKSVVSPSSNSPMIAVERLGAIWNRRLKTTFVWGDIRRPTELYQWFQIVKLLHQLSKGIVYGEDVSQEGVAEESLKTIASVFPSVSLIVQDELTSAIVYLVFDAQRTADASDTVSAIKHYLSKEDIQQRLRHLGLEFDDGRFEQSIQTVIDRKLIMTDQDPFGRRTVYKSSVEYRREYSN